MPSFSYKRVSIYAVECANEREREDEDEEEKSCRDERKKNTTPVT